MTSIAEIARKNRKEKSEPSAPDSEEKRAEKRREFFAHAERLGPLPTGALATALPPDDAEPPLCPMLSFRADASTLKSLERLEAAAHEGEIQKRSRSIVIRRAVLKLLLPEGSIPTPEIEISPEAKDFIVKFRADEVTLQAIDRLKKTFGETRSGVIRRAIYEADRVGK